MITDFIESRNLKDGVLTVAWKKSGSYKYRKLKGIWIKLGKNVDEKCSDIQSEFLDKQLTLIQ